MHHEKEHRRARAKAAVGLLSLALGLSASADTRVLALAYSGTFGLDPNIYNFANNLSGPGYEITFQLGGWTGDLANHLNQSTFDQVWLWDQEIGSNNLNDADRAALSSWYAAHPYLALDSRSTAIRVENDATETQFARNIRDRFRDAGGGLWIGASAAPTYAATGNSWLSYAGAGLFTGTWEGNIGPFTGAAGHPFLAGLDVQGLRYLWGVRSAAPTLGPGGIPLDVVVRDHLGNPLLTTNIPEPAAFVVLVLGGLLWFRTRSASERRVGTRSASERGRSGP